MIPELGLFALVLALCFGLLMGAAGTPLLARAGVAPGSADAWAALARRSATMVLVLCGIATAALVWAFVSHDLSVRYVASNSHSTLPLLYRLSAMWGSHEGSMLLWVLTLAGWVSAVALSTRRVEADLACRLLSVLGLVQAGLLLFVLLGSNPFTRLIPSAAEGADLNPLLQDPGMAFHPPALYLGYVGFAVPFAFVVACLWAGRMPATWLAWLRPWALAAWAALTVGIVLGSHWAYRVLGWGGWWFWDPVENASLLPWLTGVALLHLLPAAIARGTFRRAVVLLAIAGFALSLIGTFLVRSGAITSVHAFATDPRRGVFILSLLGLTVGTALLLHGARAHRLASGPPFGLVSRQTFLLVNALLFSVASATVLLATVYPMALEAFGGPRISVGAPYFEAVLVPLMLPALLAMVPAPLAGWDQAAGRDLLRRCAWAAGAALGAALLAAALHADAWRFGPVLGAAVGTWVLAGTLFMAAARVRRDGRRALTRRSAALWIAHAGIGVFVVAVSLLRGGQVEREVAMAVGETQALGRYQVTLQELQAAAAHNHDAVRARFLLRDGAGRALSVLEPQSRRYRTQEMTVSVPAMDIGPWRDVYVALGNETAPGTWGVRLQYKPMMSWVWIGFLLAGVGAALGALPTRRTAPAAEPVAGIDGDAPATGALA
ncbi:heme lyase CcmF/NrfE family subunit [Ramlibacter sp. USB13]|uniref:Heme lyase CcmF/NrfE family subunit n=1 Tax=Ramlibacter cellulosilyticus TaxID=2764187 RepID=A0A923SCC7_9BURK|nr:heme lyase CcmF/NrfE family subunit [Ramlibacter cellulosilyticus]MBC5784108.1 heme lyase CcmF/NrfE family subunit [Ramlibacter cellulosilyticus]